MREKNVSNAFRDEDVRFSARERGIWLRSGETPRLLLLRNCVGDAGEERSSFHCVGSRDITTLTFTLSSTPPTEITFSKGILPYIRTGKTASQRFHLFQRELQALGFTTYDLS